jgi:hypothetical protein
VNGKNPKVKKCPKTDHHIAARVLDFSFFLLNKQTNEQKAPADEMERASRNPNILQQTNGFLSSTILGNPQSMLYPLSLYPLYPFINMQKRHQKQTGANHPLPSIQAPSQQQNKFLLLTRPSLSLSLSLSLSPSSFLPVAYNPFQLENSPSSDRKPRAPSYQRKSLPKTKFPRQSLQNRKKH